LTYIQIQEYAENDYAGDLMQWAALVCSLCEKSLRNFTTDFVDNKPFECMVNFYYSRKRTILPQKYQKYLGSMLGEIPVRHSLMNSRQEERS
jgi:hypothetical protein